MADKPRSDTVWKEALACVDIGTSFELIEAYDKAKDYTQRNIYVYHALALAARKGLECGIRYDDTEGKEWPVVVIKLPTGEVAWHCQACPLVYDNHSTDEKYQRIKAYVATLRWDLTACIAVFSISHNPTLINRFLIGVG